MIAQVFSRIAQVGAIVGGIGYATSASGIPNYNAQVPRLDSIVPKTIWPAPDLEQCIIRSALDHVQPGKKAKKPGYTQNTFEDAEHGGTTMVVRAMRPLDKDYYAGPEISLSKNTNGPRSLRVDYVYASTGRTRGADTQNVRVSVEYDKENLSGYQDLVIVAGKDANSENQDVILENALSLAGSITHCMRGPFIDLGLTKN